MLVPLDKHTKWLLTTDVKWWFVFCATLTANPGRFLIGYYQGSQQANWRSYIGETSAKAIKKLPIEKQEKSTIKYTNFFLAFAVGSFFLAFGPGERKSLGLIFLI